FGGNLRGDVYFSSDARSPASCGDSQAVVAVGSDNHALGSAVGTERQHLIAGSTQLERAGLLQIFQLEEKLRALIGKELRNPFSRSFGHERANARRSLLNHVS